MMKTTLVCIGLLPVFLIAALPFSTLALTTHIIDDLPNLGGYACLGDLDSDGDMDVVYCRVNQIVWAENSGTGHFKRHALFEVSELAESVEMADIENDGDMDLVVSNLGYGIIAYQTGDMNFTPTHTFYIDYPALGDFDADGNVDIFSYSYQGGVHMAGVFMGDGSGGFSQTANLDIQRHEDLYQIGDVNGDGLWDWYKPSDMGTSYISYEFYHTGGHSSEHFNVVLRTMDDFDRDGDQDFCGIRQDGTTIVLSRQGPMDQFTHTSVGRAVDGTRMKSLNWDRDNYPDVVLSNPNVSTRIQILINNRIGFISTDYNTPYSYNGIKTGDIDGDGDDDILCFTDFGYEAKIFWIENDLNFPDVKVCLSPRNPPISLPPGGGYVRYDGSVLNRFTEPQTGELWAQVRLPDGTEPVLWVQPLNLIPWQPMVVYDVHQMVPAFAPDGLYEFGVLVGTYPDQILAHDTFSFWKQGVPGDSPESGDPNRTDEVDPETHRQRVERIARATAQPWPIDNSGDDHGESVMQQR